MHTPEQIAALMPEALINEAAPPVSSLYNIEAYTKELGQIATRLDQLLAATQAGYEGETHAQNFAYKVSSEIMKELHGLSSRIKYIAESMARSGEQNFIGNIPAPVDE